MKAALVHDPLRPCYDCGQTNFNTVLLTQRPDSEQFYNGPYGVKVWGKLVEALDCLNCGLRQHYTTKRAAPTRVVRPVREAVVQSLRMRVRIH